MPEARRRDPRIPETRIMRPEQPGRQLAPEPAPEPGADARMTAQLERDRQLMDMPPDTQLDIHQAMLETMYKKQGLEPDFAVRERAFGTEDPDTGQADKWAMFQLHGEVRRHDSDPGRVRRVEMDPAQRRQNLSAPDLIGMFNRNYNSLVRRARAGELTRDALAADLVAMYRKMHGNTEAEPPQEWMDEQQRFWTETPPDELFENANEYLRQAIEARKPKLRREYKLHLNPRGEALAAVTNKFFELLATDEQARQAVQKFKIACRNDLSEPLMDGNDPEARPVAPIVIYPRMGADAEQSREMTWQLAKKLKQALGEYEQLGQPMDRAPRYNLPLDRLLHVAQCDADLKKSLASQEDPRVRDWAEGGELSTHQSLASDTMRESTFDAELNYAAMHEDADWIREYYAELQSPEARRAVERSTVEREKALVEQRIRETDVRRAA